MTARTCPECGAEAKSRCICPKCGASPHGCPTIMHNLGDMYETDAFWGSGDYYCYYGDKADEEARLVIRAFPKFPATRPTVEDAQKVLAAYLFDEKGNEYCRDCGHSHSWGAWNHRKVRRNRCASAGIPGIGDCPCRKWNGIGPADVGVAEGLLFCHPARRHLYPEREQQVQFSAADETRVRNLCELGWSREEAEKAVRANP